LRECVRTQTCLRKNLQDLEVEAKVVLSVFFGWIKVPCPWNNPLLKVRLFPNRVAAARMRSRPLVGTGSRAVGRFSHGGQFSPGGDARRHDTMHKCERSAAYI